MASALAFCLTALVVAAAALPICHRVFRRFPDGGAGLSPALGLLLSSFAYFILRTAHILPPGRGGFLLAVVLLAVTSAAVIGRDRRLAATLRRSWRGTAAAALLFTTAFLGYAAFRSYESAIGGTEQPMDFLYLNAMLESESFPPEDPWLAGERASYYYFGYLQAAVLTASSGVESSVGYNLSLAAVFASSATAVASIAAAAARWTLGRRPGNWPVFAAGAGVVSLLFLASLAGAFELVAAHEHYNEGLYRALGVDYLLPCETGQAEGCYAGPVAPRTTAWYPTEFWFWWDPTRLVPNTIIEFPVFSFVLGDLHPHVMAIPGVLLALALSAATWRGTGALSWHSHRRAPWSALLVAVAFGGLAFTNAWDVFAGSLLLALGVSARNLRALSPSRALAASAGYLLPPALAAVVLYSPWLIDFSSQAGGIYAYTREGTRPAHAFLQFGVPLFLASLALFALRRRDGRQLANVMLQTGWLPLVPLLAWVLLALVRGDWDAAASNRTGAGYVTLAILGLLLWILAAAAIHLHRARHAAALPVTLAAVATLLLFGVELFFIRDVFFGGFPRQNTVFKFAYQAWILLAVAGAAGLTVAAHAAAQRRPGAFLASILAAPLLVAALLYAAGAIPNRTNGFENPTSMDGLAALARNDPAEYALTRWVAENTRPGDVVLEASGRVWRAGANGPEIQVAGSDWSQGGRIASRTGRPSLIGWDGHERQWRGSAIDDEIARRQEAIDATYLAADQSIARAHLQAYDVRYVVVGRVELTNYPAPFVTDFADFMDVAFELDGLRVYRLRQSAVVPTS